MAKESIGYIGKDKEKWFARITFTDSKGRRKNVKRLAKSESDANDLMVERRISDPMALSRSAKVLRTD